MPKPFLTYAQQLIRLRDEKHLVITGDSLYQYGKNDLFAVVIAFRYLLPKQEFLEFKRVLTAQLDNFLKSTTHISEEELLRAMGFPANWKKISLYRLECT